MGLNDPRDDSTDRRLRRVRMENIITPTTALLHVAAVDWAAVARVPETAEDVSIATEGADVVVTWWEVR